MIISAPVPVRYTSPATRPAELAAVLSAYTGTDVRFRIPDPLTVALVFPKDWILTELPLIFNWFQVGPLVAWTTAAWVSFPVASVLKMLMIALLSCTSRVLPVEAVPIPTWLLTVSTSITEVRSRAT